ncbi:MAG: response regulator [Candidatus Cloacimonetes bacterium]|nr:response regulator [Candidatus Cloacimonadota bacterium]MCF7815365.1 response regulator [Candidatus Cloacimonadota bacterium]MCF7868541.1 response regulator [Candidatus Cloacimonadota bacterium]MCF7884039.1 response regulator [Candidatus Cloacimonadota bacterium]
MRAREIEILLVEDNLNDVKLTKKALQKQDLNAKVAHVENGQEAIDYIFCRNKFSDRKKSSFPNLILLDLKLPKMDGLEVLKILKKDERTKSIPIVVLTSSDQDSDIEKSYDLGANSYIVKPVDFDQFMKSVTELGLYWFLLNEYTS